MPRRCRRRRRWRLGRGRSKFVVSSDAAGAQAAAWGARATRIVYPAPAASKCCGGGNLHKIGEDVTAEIGRPEVEGDLSRAGEALNVRLDLWYVTRVPRCSGLIAWMGCNIRSPPLLARS